MNVLLDITFEPMANFGDIAQAQVAVSRLRTLCPDASFQVITTHPSRVPLFFPNVSPVPDHGHSTSIVNGVLLGRLWRISPALERTLRTVFPRQVFPLIAARCHARGADGSGIQGYFDAIDAADLVIIPGGSWVMDPFSTAAIMTLETIAIAQRLRKPTALMGHGARAR